MSEEEQQNDNTRETLKKKLELELGLPLYPRKAKMYRPRFDGDSIILNHYPVDKICSLEIGGKEISQYILMERDGLIHLPHFMRGALLVEYTHCIPEEEYAPLLDLLVEYETDTDKLKDATSVSEGKVSIGFDRATTKGAIIQGLIEDLRRRHSYSVRVV